MSNTPRHQFPPLQKAANTPAWLSRKGSPNDDVKTLVSLLQGDPQPPKQAQEPPAAAAPTPPPIYPPESDRPPPRQHAQHGLHPGQPPESQLNQPLDMQDDVPIGRLPGPPRIGSLVPGGRSNPPPANDQRDDGMAEAIQAFASAALELSIARAATLAVLEGQLLDLSIEVAEALIEKEVEMDPTLHAALARAALQSLGDSTNVTLRTSPDGFEAITSALGGADVEVRGVRVHIVSDPTIPGLGCVVDGDNVRVDASVSERLRAVRRAFEEERRRAAENVE
jgi:vacuolar-type H+-ATPase subunit E/Vma4